MQTTRTPGIELRYVSHGTVSGKIYEIIDQSRGTRQNRIGLVTAVEGTPRYLISIAAKGNADVPGGYGHYI